MRIIFACGGTAGHIYPAISIAHLVRKEYPDADIHFVGTIKGMENDLVPSEGFSCSGLDIEGFLRSFSPHNLTVAAKIRAAERRMHEMYRSDRPDLVIGTGGYACFPAIAQAHREKIVTAIHESNTLPGLAVRLLKHKADRIWCGSKEAVGKLGRSGKAMYTGTPVRPAFAVWNRTTARLKHGIPGDRFFVLSFGGSLGASAVNRAVREIFDGDLPPSVKWMHLTGKGGIGLFSDRQNSGTKTYAAFSTEIPSLMHAADLVICRAGALTLTELAFCGKAALLIPSPNVTDNHQFFNAKERADAGGAVLIDEKDLSGARLYAEVSALVADKARIRAMQDAMRSFFCDGCEKMILSDIRRLLSFGRCSAIDYG